MVRLLAGKRYVTIDLDPDDHISRQITRFRQFYEQDLLDDVRARLNGRTGTAVDVGAHIGNHSLFFAAACGLDVVALEPNPVTRQRLEANITANGLRIRVIDKAAGREAGKARLVAARPGNSGMTSVRFGEGSTDVVALDDLGLTNVVLLKIDVESQELAVLNGARRLIEQQHPLIYVEAATEARRTAVDALLKPFGYRRFGRYAKTPTYGYEARERVAVSVSAAIMAHPKRASYVPGLQDRLEGARVVWDEKNNRWDTGRRSLLAYDPNASHHVVVQDDAIVCLDFLAGLRNAIEEHADYPISLYLGRQRPHALLFDQAMGQARRQNARWIANRELCWGVALCFPTALIEPMVAWGDANTRWENYDMRLSRYLETNQIPTLYTVPSLADHRRQEESPSLIPGRTGSNRVAHWFIGETESALTLDWTGPVIGTRRFKQMRVLV